MVKAKDRRVKEDNDINDINKSIGLENITSIKNEVNKLIPANIRLMAKNDSQIELINSIKNNQITICAGNAGSGKTYVAVSEALRLLRKDTSTYKKIYLVKSVTALKDEEMGFLKGGFLEKIEPFMWSFYFNLEKIVSEASLKILLDKSIIRPFPIAYMRGASIDDAIVIIDEVQNITVENIETIMTRIGTNCKYIILGDRNQMDLKNKTLSALKPIVKIFADKSDIGIIEMSIKDDNVRNPIIKMIQETFNEYKKENKTEVRK